MLKIFFEKQNDSYQLVFPGRAMYNIGKKHTLRCCLTFVIVHDNIYILFPKLSLILSLTYTPSEYSLCNNAFLVLHLKFSLRTNDLWLQPCPVDRLPNVCLPKLLHLAFWRQFLSDEVSFSLDVIIHVRLFLMLLNFIFTKCIIM